MIYKQKIYIDRESKQVTEIETPLGKFETKVPALVLFALDFVPLIYPIVKSASFAEEVRIKANVRATSYPVQICAVIQWDSLLQDRDFSLKVPSLRKFGEEYEVLYVAKNVVLEDRAELESQKNREIALPDKGSVKGSVIDANTEQGIPGLIIKLTPPKATQRPQKVTSMTNKVSSASRRWDGRLSVGGLSGGCPCSIEMSWTQPSLPRKRLRWPVIDFEMNCTQSLFHLISASGRCRTYLRRERQSALGSTSSSTSISS